jgi:acetoin:2,6-dichlorophenolindophenol oxidoreductase subunit beta
MSKRTIFYRAAINEAISGEMERDPDVFIMGEDVAVYGGVYKASDGLLSRFGPERVRDTPISEAAIVGAGIGAAMQGMRPVVEIMYADFIPIAMDQIVNQACQMYFVSAGQVPVPLVVRTQGGAGAFAGAQHSKNLESWFTHIPGIKVVAPATPYDAKGLLTSAIRDDNPVIFFEHKRLYRTTGHVPETAYTIPIGKAEIKRPGDDITIVAWSQMVREALRAAETLAAEGISAEVIDLRTLSPLDEETLCRSVKRTHRAVVVQEGWRRNGFAAEVITVIQETVFDYLDAPLTRVTGLDSPVPFSPVLEKQMIPTTDDIAGTVRKLLSE